MSEAIRDIQTRCIFYISFQEDLMELRNDIKNMLYHCLLCGMRKKHEGATDDELNRMIAEEFEICAWPVNFYRKQ